MLAEPDQSTVRESIKKAIIDFVIRDTIPCKSRANHAYKLCSTLPDN